MDSPLSITSKPSFHHQKISVFNPPNFNLIKPKPLFKPSKHSTTNIIASTKPQNNPITITQTLKLTARTVVFSAAAAAAVLSKFHQYPAVAQPITTESETHIPEFLESNSESITAMKTLLQQKLEAGEEEDQEALKILKKLVSAEPENVNWKLLTARLLIETGETEPAREALQQILTENPLSFELLFENPVLIDSFREGETVVKRLETALEVAVEGSKEKEAKDIRLIIAQVRFLQENIDVALKKYDELVSEDPDDSRAYFCKGMVYCLIDENDEAKVQFAKYRELSPEKFEVEGDLGITPLLSRLKLFGTDGQN
ncbi:hypothetical protein SSX86_004491 [Deinandra increscens subsp. villosa]|uniref:Uncharacterized protein n=1 Tax=Deinandra increscens subsp. villosa TaxID=3103831 RepID=A0AAP0DN97_9ASTR